MRRLLGLLILLYGLLLAINTTAPTLAKLTSEKVLATVGSNCSADLGSPPFGGLYGSCDASLPGLDEGGRVFGAHLDSAGHAMYVYRYPLLDSYAVVPPSNTDQVAGIIAVLIIVLGILLLVSDRKRATQAVVDEEAGDSSETPLASDA
jgi:hypothetical protein